MTGFTVPLLFPYPQPADPADAPAQIQALAEAVDAEMTDTETQLSAITDPPIAWIRAGTQVIPPAAGTLILFNQEAFDNANMVDLVTDPYSITIRSNGLYMISCEGSLEANGVGGRQLELLVNGVVVGLQASGPPTTAPFGWSAEAAVMRSCVVGDKVQFRIGHTAAFSISTTGCEAQVFRVSV